MTHAPSINMNHIIGCHHVLLMVLDALRYDVAQDAHEKGLLPNFSRLLPPSGWQLRHTPGNFTYPAHQAMFAGFLPTPARPGNHPRLFATRFEGSLTTNSHTCVFDEADIVSGMASRGYRTVCGGGVGFFNKKTALSRVFPDLFMESHWQPRFAVTDPNSTEHQLRWAAQIIRDQAPRQPLFLFINISAIHQPNYFYLPGAEKDSWQSHQAALAYVDTQLPLLLQAMQAHGPWFGIVCSDHGTAYGEHGFFGHRHNHPVVMEVPYGEFICKKSPALEQGSNPL